MTIKDEDKVIISFEKVPIKKAFKRARKSFLLILIILGFVAGTVYTKFIRTVPTTSAQQNIIQK